MYEYIFVSRYDNRYICYGDLHYAGYVVAQPVNTMKKGDVLVTVKALVPTPSGSGVFLTDGQKVIAIFVDIMVATAIGMYLSGEQTPRPLTHDLMGHFMAGFSIELQKVVINDLKQETFFARLFLRQHNELGTAVVELDARPSDSVALALQQEAPIYVDAAVWETADDMSWALEDGESTT